jgi:hypothetical protein
MPSSNGSLFITIKPKAKLLLQSPAKQYLIKSYIYFERYYQAAINDYTLNMPGVDPTTCSLNH